MKLTSILFTAFTMALVNAQTVKTSPNANLLTSSPLLDKRTGCKGGCRMYKRSEFLSDEFKEGAAIVEKRTGGCKCPCFCRRSVLERRSIGKLDFLATSEELKSNPKK